MKIQKISKKFISLILAMMVVLSSLTVGLSAFAEGTPEHYVVKWRTPAIPVYEGYRIDLSLVDVQFTENGDPIDGGNISWSYPEQNGAILRDRIFTVINRGVQRLEATYGDNTCNVWVIANQYEDDVFYLENIDFSSDDFYNDSSLAYSKCSGALVYDPTTATYKTGLQSFSGNYIKRVDKGTDGMLLDQPNIYHSSATGILQSEILKDFADYTVSLRFKFNSEQGTRSAIGIVARATIGTDENGVAIPYAADSTAFVATMHNAGGVSFNGVGASAVKFGSNGNDRLLYNTLPEAQQEKIWYDLNDGKINPEYVLWSNANTSAGDKPNASKVRTAELKLSGNDVAYSLDGNVIFDSASKEVYNTKKSRSIYDVYSPTGDEKYKLLSEEQMQMAIDLAAQQHNGYVATKDKFCLPKGSFYVDSKTVTFPDDQLDINGNKIGKITLYPSQSHKDSQYFANSTASAEQFAGYMQQANTSKGSVGFSVIRSGFHGYSLSVKLNSDISVPLQIMSKAADIFVVNDSQPFLPMTEGYKINTSDFFVTDEFGKAVSASAVEWSNTNDQSALAVENGGYISAYKAGSYIINGVMKNGDETTNVELFISVKKSDADKYTLFEADYRNGEATVSDDWSTYIYIPTYQYDSSGNITTTKKGQLHLLSNDGTNHISELSQSYGFAPYTSQNVRDFINGHEKFDPSGSNSVYVITVLNNKYIEKLNDYTVNATVYQAQSYRSKFGLSGKTQVSTEDNYFKTTAALVSPRVTWNGGTHKKLYLFNNTTDLVSYNLENPEWLYITDVSESSQGFRLKQYSLDFSGNKLTYSTAAGEGSKITSTIDADLLGKAGFMQYDIYYSNEKARYITGEVVLYDFSVTTTVDEAKVNLLNAVAISDYSSSNTAYPSIPSGNYVPRSTYNISDFKNTLKIVNDTTGYLDAVIPSNFVKIGHENSVIFSGTTFGIRNIDMSALGSVTVNSAALSATCAERIILPATASTVTVKDGAFKNNSKLMFIENTQALSNLSASMLEGCVSLTSFDFPTHSSITATGTSILKNAKSLRQVTIPENITTISESTFYACESLYDVTIPKNMSTIGKTAFSGCSSLTEINLPESVTTVGVQAFDNCANLHTLIFNNKNTAIDSTTLSFSASGATAALPEGATVYGYIGSTAQTYVNTYNTALDSYIVGLETDSEKASAEKYRLIFKDIETLTHYEVSRFGVLVLPKKYGSHDITGYELVSGNAIIENDLICAVGNEGDTLLVNASYNSSVPQSVVLNISVTAYNADNLSNIVQVDNAQTANAVSGITCIDANANKFSVNLNSGERIDYDTLKIKSQLDKASAYDFEAASDGRAFVFTANDGLAQAQIYFSLESDSAHWQGKIYNLGSQSRAKTAEKEAGLGFVSRAMFTSPANDQYTAYNYAQSFETVVDGVSRNVTPVTLGAIVVPKAIIESPHGIQSENFVLSEQHIDALVKDRDADIKLKVYQNGREIAYAAHTSISPCCDLTDEFIDYRVVLTGFEGVEIAQTTDILQKSYLIYSYVDAGQTKYGVLYSDSAESSYKKTSYMTTEDYKAAINSMLVKENGVNWVAAEDTFINNLDSLGDRLEEQIMNSRNDLVKCFGNKYYVGIGGNDANDGKSPETAWATIDRVNAANLQPYDMVVLERGGTYYGHFDVPKTGGITYSAYGEGAKPIIKTAIDGLKNKWTEHPDYDNVWVYSSEELAKVKPALSGGLNTYDIGSVVFNFGIEGATEEYADKARSIETLINGLPEEISGHDATKHTHEVDSKYRYLFATDNDNMIEDRTGTELYKLYLYCEENPESFNPNKDFISIDISERYGNFEFQEGTENVTVNNLDLRFGGFGFFATGCNNIVMSYCKTSFAGGFWDGTTVRYGGGSGAWRESDTMIFDHCYFYEQFDSGVTPQYNCPQGADWGKNEPTAVFKDFITECCLFEKCEWTLEYFSTQGISNANRFENMQFKYNFCREGGYGFGDKPDWSAYIMAWGHENESVNCNIEYNVFDRAKAVTWEMGGGWQHGEAQDYSKMATLDHNVYVQEEGKEFAIYHLSYRYSRYKKATHFYIPEHIAELTDPDYEYKVDTNSVFYYLPKSAN